MLTELLRIKEIGPFMLDITQIPAPLEIYSERVRPEWIDHNGHMNVAYYLMAFDEAAGAVANQIGYTNEYRKSKNIGTFIGDYHIRYVREVLEGDLLSFTYRIVACDEKRFHYWQVQRQVFTIQKVGFIFVELDYRRIVHSFHLLKKQDTKSNLLSEVKTQQL